MTTTNSSAEGSQSAMAEPTKPVTRAWSGYWSLANFGIFLAYYGTQQILLPRQTNAITGSDAAAVSAQSWANIWAAVVAIVVSILAGALSDRTLHRTGRRQIWVVYGVTLAVVAFVFQGLQHGVVGVVIGWVVFQAGYATITVALNAAIPDDVPVNQRGTLSGYLAVGTALGPLVGVVVVTFMLTGILDAYVGLAVLLAALVLPFALRTRGRPLRADERPPLALRALVAGLFTPLRHWDFAWACSQRFLINVSNALAQIFLYQYLKDEVHTDPDIGTLYLLLAYTAGVVIVAIPAGRHSDRTGKRKRMVVVSSVLQAAAALILAFIPTLPAAIAGATLLGLGYGAYLSVDQALITQVLPTAQDRGKDLGILQIAGTLPYVAAAGLGGLLINSAGGFPALYLASMVTGLAAAFCVLPIRSVL
jgi:MFS family permease